MRRVLIGTKNKPTTFLNFIILTPFKQIHLNWLFSIKERIRIDIDCRIHTYIKTLLFEAVPAFSFNWSYSNPSSKLLMSGTLYCGINHSFLYSAAHFSFHLLCHARRPASWVTLCCLLVPSPVLTIRRLRTMILWGILVVISGHHTLISDFISLLTKAILQVSYLSLSVSPGASELLSRLPGVSSRLPKQPYLCAHSPINDE